jgi:hypothetical protein
MGQATPTIKKILHQAQKKTGGTSAGFMFGKLRNLSQSSKIALSSFFRHQHLVAP